MLRNQSIATISNPEFINIQPYNPLISECDVKVLYLGQNRNGTAINKETAIKMANSLPGTPIVGAYREEIEDFGDHGEVLTIEDGEIKFTCKTVPFGFVSPTAKVWFKDFVDTDKFGNEIERTYLMTQGYLWTGQYEESKSILAEGKGQSMELDGDTLKGEWATDSNSGVEFFIINDAIFSKLCILGDEVEPCFEGAAITSPEVSKQFSLNQEFKTTLFTMMNELKDALQNEGGSEMPQENEIFEANVEEQDVATDFVNEESTDESGVAETDFAAKDEDEKEEKEDTSDEKDAEDKDASDDAADEEDDEKKDKKFELEDEEPNTPSIEDLSYELNAANEELSALRAEVESLREFKLNVENAQKDELINSFFMLNDEDKKDVIENKSQYTLEEIKSKLSVIYVEKNVDFSMDNQNEEAEIEETPATTFSLDDDEVAGFVSPLQEALRRTVHN